MKKRMSEEEMLTMVYPFPTTRKRMKRADRAAQFSPFSALNGYERALAEIARATEEKRILDEEAKRVLDEKLKILYCQHELAPEIEITYFKKDETKAGGAYQKIIGSVKKVDEVAHVLVMKEGERIRMQDIFDIQGLIFDCLDE